MKKLVPVTLTLALLLGATVFAQRAAGAPQAAAAVAPAPSPLIAVLTADKPKTAPANDEERIARAVRHELVMQPFYSQWDWLSFRVNGHTVELVGAVHNGDLERDSVRLVQRIEGVEKVVDNIRQLPPSSFDDRIRRQVARSLFDGGLSQYDWPPVPSIHIIVSGGRVTLEGVVNNKMDHDLAFMRASGISGVFEVTNNLKVAKI
jgi:osmotically-inducible protein OsmY